MVGSGGGPSLVSAALNSLYVFLRHPTRLLREQVRHSPVGDAG